MALYRNNIKDVAKYLDQTHGVGHYKVYNLCSEREYDTTYFHGSCARYCIDDHNVPTLEQMVEFCKDAKQFLDEDAEKNVIAVHCKGYRGIGFNYITNLVECRRKGQNRDDDLRVADIQRSV